MEWMIKDKTLTDYLQACKEADITNIEGDRILMKMFNTKENYLEHLGNIIAQIGSLDRLRIIEIGGGYGALAMLINKYNPSCYHIIDLPEVCELQRRYLKNTIAECFTKSTGQEYDLVISNYALSEIPYNQEYIDKVLAKSKHGYITCNTDFVKLPWAHTRTPDIKGERETNYILTW